MARIGLILEFLAVFGAAPAAMLVLRQRLVLALVLWAGALAAWAVTRERPEPDRAGGGPELAALGRRLALVAPLLALAAWLLAPERFLSLPRERPWLWLAVTLGYPLLSVWPQEVLYRRFLLRRYAPLFGDGAGFVGASALAFGFAHVIFLNPVAVGLSAAGGVILARAYARHGSLALVWLEHSLYGWLLFTLGLGRFFYTGAAWG